MILSRLFKREPDPAQNLYEAIVAAARQPRFYVEAGVPDTVDGRFDMVVIHMYLVLDRLKSESSEAQRQALTDTFFKDMDRSLREMGTGDLSVSKKIRKMAEAFYGRIKAYDSATSEAELADAVSRNIAPEAGVAVASYILSARKTLEEQDAKQILNCAFDWPVL